MLKKTMPAEREVGYVQPEHPENPSSTFPRTEMQAIGGRVYSSVAECMLGMHKDQSPISPLKINKQIKPNYLPLKKISKEKKKQN